MESYTVGERIFLQFDVENLQNHKNFQLVGADYELTVNREVLREKGAQDTTINFNNNQITILFTPTKVGTNVLDVWYYIKVGDILGENVGQNDATECRTVRFLLNVVREEHGHKI